MLQSRLHCKFLKGKSKDITRKTNQQPNFETKIKKERSFRNININCFKDNKKFGKAVKKNFFQECFLTTAFFQFFFRKI